MIEVRVANLRGDVGQRDGVVFVFERTATDEDVALLDEAIKRLGGNGHRATIIDREPEPKSGGGGARANDG
jgi:hypothetical protein